MITVLGSPPLVVLSENPVRFQLQTDNHLEVVGEKVVFTMEFNDGGTGFEGDWIELRWGGRLIRFVYSSLPDGSVNQVHDNSVYSYLEEWLEKLTGSVVVAGTDIWILRGAVSEWILRHRYYSADSEGDWITTEGKIVMANR